MRFQYELRGLLSIVTVIGIALAIIRRPLGIVLGGICSADFWSHFIMPFLHLPWLVGFDVEYPTSVASSPAFFGLLFGVVISIVTHFVLVVVLVCTVAEILKWGGYTALWDSMQLPEDERPSGRTMTVGEATEIVGIGNEEASSCPPAGAEQAKLA